jgi:DNA-binding transcriptional LysR family regulator
MISKVMDWNHVQLFLSAAERGSLTAAAQALGISTATAARHLSALEQQVGGELTVRSKTGIRLTALGAQFLAEAADLTALHARIAHFAKRAQRSILRPPVRVSATEAIITDYLAPALVLLPASVRVDLVSITAVVDLERVEADLAIRMFRPGPANIVMQQVATFALGLFAAPRYLAGRYPHSLDLSQERFLGYSGVYGDIAEIRWFRDQGLSQCITHVSTSSRGLLAAAQAGAGIALLSRAAALSANLIEVDAPPIPPRDAWLVSRPQSKGSADIKQVKSWIVAALTGCRPT